MIKAKSRILSTTEREPGAWAYCHNLHYTVLTADTTLAVYGIRH